MRRRLKILTWHVHGSYLYYLSHIDHDIYLPVKDGRPEGYGGRTASFPWPGNVHEVAAEDVASGEYDVVLFQSHQNYLRDQHEILSPAQHHLPRIYLEHDPPRQHPTDTHHPVDDPEVLLVHVTAFNELMWDSLRTPTRVIEHGVVVDPDVRYRGDIPRGIAVVNCLPSRGRRLGADIFERVRERVPLDLAGMQSERVGGVGDVPLSQLHAFTSRYRFFFNPIRYTSMGLAVCEAMMIGMPIAALATTEMASVIENGVSGVIDTRVPRLIDAMEALLRDPGTARRLGEGSRRVALERFNIDRFKTDWHDALATVSGSRPALVTGRNGGTPA
jgi:glycosyltransferase involved in cell wall biosynthesis